MESISLVSYCAAEIIWEGRQIFAARAQNRQLSVKLPSSRCVRPGAVRSYLADKLRRVELMRCLSHKIRFHLDREFIEASIMAALQQHAMRQVRTPHVGQASSGGNDKVLQCSLRRLDIEVTADVCK